MTASMNAVSAAMQATVRDLKFAYKTTLDKVTAILHIVKTSR